MQPVTTPHSRLMAALRGSPTDRVPFAVYENKLPQCTAERELRNRGLCILYRRQSFREIMPNVRVSSLSWTDERGRRMVRTTYSTPDGDLSELVEPAGFTNWTREYLFKSPEDYKALLFLLRDLRYMPDYEGVLRVVQDLGPDFAVRDELPLEPLQALISQYMGTEAFCYEWMDNRDEVLRLYQALVEANRRVYGIVAGSPLEFANYGGNATPSVIGAEAFRRYYMPNYEEAAEALHAKGKLIGTHLDADNTLIMDDVAATPLDYIEAYDPGVSPPVAQARRAWPGKALWINWPCAWQLRDPQTVRQLTRQLIDEAGPRNGFIIGITEDVPPDRWRANFAAILDGIDDRRL